MNADPSTEREEAAEGAADLWTHQQGYAMTGTEWGAFGQGHLAGSAWARTHLAAVEHRATRAEAQSAIRGRAVVMYRERARKAEAERDEWRQTALDERAAALDALEQIKVRDARAADIWDEGSAAFEIAYKCDHADPWPHLRDNPYRASEGE